MALATTGCSLAAVPAHAAAPSVQLGIAAPIASVPVLARMLHPRYRMTYISWSASDSPRWAFDAARRYDATPVITWQPRRLTAPGDLSADPAYSNAAIAAGRQDAYVRRFARTVRAFRDPVYLRYAHEMNGWWFPWSADAAAYVRAWRHVWTIFQQEHARNVRWIFSVNPNTSQDQAALLKGIALYWPGGRYVDVVGSTLVRFRFQLAVRPEADLARLAALAAYGKPLWLTEVKVDYPDRRRWLDELACALAGRPEFRTIIWSETPSMAQLRNQRGTGNMNWSARYDPQVIRLLRSAVTERRCPTAASPPPAGRGTTRTAARSRGSARSRRSGSS